MECFSADVSRKIKATRERRKGVLVAESTAEKSYAGGPFITNGAEWKIKQRHSDALSTRNKNYERDDRGDDKSRNELSLKYPFFSTIFRGEIIDEIFAFQEYSKPGSWLIFVD